MIFVIYDVNRVRKTMSYIVVFSKDYTQHDHIKLSSNNNDKLCW